MRQLTLLKNQTFANYLYKLVYFQQKNKIIGFEAIEINEQELTMLQIFTNFFKVMNYGK